MPLFEAFRRHPASVGETYAEHLRHATGFGARMILGGFACIVHGLLPFVFVRTGSTQIRTLHDHMVTGRSKAMPAILDFVI
ncbi:MAG TPA: DUF6356 family protein [Novosphingobium sp.]|nr:DUF6356 family protein [Novosphingobium sp.]